MCPVKLRTSDVSILKGMTYKDALIASMDDLARLDKVRFIGYNVLYGHKMSGTLNDIPADKCIEMPVAENLMVGVAMGLSLTGYLPVVCFERMDFMLVAADAIINHLDKLPKLSGGQFDFPMILRCCVGHTKPLDPGLQHTQNFGGLFATYTDIEVHGLGDVASIIPAYTKASNTTKPVMLIEYKELYPQVYRGGK